MDILRKYSDAIIWSGLTQMSTIIHAGKEEKDRVAAFNAVLRVNKLADDRLRLDEEGDDGVEDDLTRIGEAKDGDK